MSDSKVDTSKFKIGLGRHLLDGMMTGAPTFWRLLGQLESMVLSEQLEDVRITKPVYVTGLARSGTTILLEVLAGHNDVVCHRYSDFPGLYTPYWWGQANQHADSELQERAHGDGLMVSQKSPEAMEEVLWMAHFGQLHDTASKSVLDKTANNPAFEKEYREHIRKLLLLRNGERYVAKGNYNLARMEYILKIFPDAKFVIPVRHPVDHIASLVKQHELFYQGQQEHPRSRAHLKRVGHFEFGLDRCPINFGDQDLIDEIVNDWQTEHSVRGWSKYWAMVYAWVDRQISQNASLASQVKFVRYEDLCSQSESTLESVLQFADLYDANVVESWSGKLKAPNYYEPKFNSDDLSTIREHCSEVAQRYGYQSDSWRF